MCTKTETCKQTLPNITNIDPYNFDQYRFEVDAFLRHSVGIGASAAAAAVGLLYGTTIIITG